MQEKVKIEVWSDLICPWCWIGKARLEKALEASPIGDRYELVHKAYRLAPGGKVQEAAEMLAQRYGGGADRVQTMFGQVAKAGAQDGLAFEFEGTLHGDTLDGQRLVLWAARYGKQSELLERFYKAHFSEQISIFDRKNLLELVAAVGLDPKEAEATLNSEEYKDQVEGDEYQARTLGAGGVPFFVFADKYAVSGAQSKEVFGEVLEKVFAELPKPVMVGPDGVEVCGPEGCTPGGDTST